MAEDDGLVRRKRDWLRAIAAAGARDVDKLICHALAGIYMLRSEDAWPSRESLCLDTGKDRRTVTRAIARLELAGVLNVDRKGRTGKGRQAPNTYALVWPFDEARAAQVLSARAAWVDRQAETPEGQYRPPGPGGPYRPARGAVQTGQGGGTAPRREEKRKEEKVSGERTDLFSYKDPGGYTWADFPHDHPEMACELHGALVPRVDPKTGELFAGCPVFAETRCESKYDPRHRERARARAADAEQAQRVAAARSRFAYPGTNAGPSRDPAPVGTDAAQLAAQLGVSA